MKKILFVAALSAMAMTSCVDEEAFVVENSAEQPMRFDMPVMAQTRAEVHGEISGVKYPEAENFMVYCKAYTGAFAGWTNSADITDYFNANGEVAKNGHTAGAAKYWATDIVHYWPEIEYNLAFAAYSPAELLPEPTSVAHTEEGLQIKGFQTEAVADNQYDLMYAKRVYDLNKNTHANAAVPMVFNHALSSIVFSSQKSSADVNYIITDLKVEGKFCQKGDFNQNIVEDNTGGVYSEAEAPVWYNLAEASDVTYAPTFTEFSVPADAPAQFTSGTSALLLIPQAVPADATVTVYYDKITNPGTSAEKILSTSATIKLRDFSYNKEGVIHNVTAWERGKRYVYRIAFGENTRIYFEPSVTDWVQEPTLIYTIK